LLPFLSATHIPVYVMLELDVVQNDGTLKYESVLEQQLQQLKSGDVDGIMLDMWWGIIQREGPMQYDWNAYLKIASMAQRNGLKMQVVTSFHKCGTNQADACYIPLPSWILNVSHNNPDIFYKDANGNYDEEYLNLGVDNLPLFNGRNPVQIYKDFFQSFLKNFAQFIPQVISEVEISLGPAGEMRYPGYQLAHWHFPGVGEFQCYDKYLASFLQDAAAAIGHKEWGVPPNNAGSYNSAPEDTVFFMPSNKLPTDSCDGSNRRDCGFVGINQQQCEAKGCCWKPSNQGNLPWCFYKNSPGLGNFQSDYGQFFLEWYQSQLLNHGDRIVGNFSQLIRDMRPDIVVGRDLILAVKIAGIHWLWKTPSHAAELTTGYKNDKGQAYFQIAKMLAKHNATFDFTCLEMRDSEQQGANCRCAPEELVYQTLQAAKQYNLRYSGENALERYDQTAYNTIEWESTRLFPISGFTYLRLGTTLLSGNNWQTFRNFVHTMHNVGQPKE
jgi:beta-amylase